jgi:hypothetical protein
LIYVAVAGGVLLALAVSFFFFVRRRNEIHEEFAALADELQWAPSERYLVGKPTRVPTYIAPTDEVVLLDRRVRRVELRARVLTGSNSRKDRELNF